MTSRKRKEKEFDTIQNKSLDSDIFSDGGWWPIAAFAVLTLTYFLFAVSVASQSPSC